MNLTVFYITTTWLYFTGADPGFQVRRAHLKKLRRAEVGAKSFGVFRVKNHDFPILGVAYTGCTPPPPDPPLLYIITMWLYFITPKLYFILQLHDCTLLKLTVLDITTTILFHTLYILQLLTYFIPRILYF